jgi:hypothetical protein
VFRAISKRHIDAHKNREEIVGLSAFLSGTVDRKARALDLSLRDARKVKFA